MITQGQAIVSGEITTTADVDYETIVSNTLKDVRHTTDELGAASAVSKSKHFSIKHNIVSQSTHIAQEGVDSSEDHEQTGDQGLMFGYACDETPELIPLPIQLAQKLSHRLTKLRKNKTLEWLKPDGKSQVSVEYIDNLRLRVKNVVIATQHKSLLNKFKSEEEEHKFISENVIEKLYFRVLNEYKIDYDENFIVNGTGRFVIGGPLTIFWFNRKKNYR